ncbi:hypothetical protein [Actinoplanes subglobosus]|uniref:Uncharacterized protein n=1 Tax=Actinoplanes subglobosus TaxID=1547892 RepID=A0ABV8IUY9_9ACTN
MPVTLSGTPAVLVYASALVLAALVAAAVLHGSRRYPVAVIALVVILVFTVVLLTAGVDPLVVTAIVGAAGMAASRLGSRRSRRI